MEGAHDMQAPPIAACRLWKAHFHKLGSPGFFDAPIYPAKVIAVVEHPEDIRSLPQKPSATYTRETGIRHRVKSHIAHVADLIDTYGTEVALVRFEDSNHLAYLPAAFAVLVPHRLRATLDDQVQVGRTHTHTSAPNTRDAAVRTRARAAVAQRHTGQRRSHTRSCRGPAHQRQLSKLRHAGQSLTPPPRKLHTHTPPQVNYTTDSVTSGDWYRVPRSPNRLAVAIGLDSLETAADLVQKCREKVGIPVSIPAGNANNDAPADCVLLALVAACPAHAQTILANFTHLPTTLEHAASFAHKHNIAKLTITTTRTATDSAIHTYTKHGVIARTRLATGATDHAVYLSPIPPNTQYRTLHDAQTNTIMLATPHNLQLAGITAYTQAAVVVPV